LAAAASSAHIAFIDIATHKENLIVTTLFSEFSMLWLTKAVARRTKTARQAGFAAFKTLHAIQWSAPWRTGRT